MLENEENLTTVLNTKHPPIRRIRAVSAHWYKVVTEPQDKKSLLIQARSFAIQIQFLLMKKLKRSELLI